MTEQSAPALVDVDHASVAGDHRHGARVGMKRPREAALGSAEVAHRLLSLGEHRAEYEHRERGAGQEQVQGERAVGTDAGSERAQVVRRTPHGEQRDEGEKGGRRRRAETHRRPQQERERQVEKRRRHLRQCARIDDAVGKAGEHQGQQPRLEPSWEVPGAPWRPLGRPCGQQRHDRQRRERACEHARRPARPGLPGALPFDGRDEGAVEQRRDDRRDHGRGDQGDDAAQAADRKSVAGDEAANHQAAHHALGQVADQAADDDRIRHAALPRGREVRGNGGGDERAPALRGATSKAPNSTAPGTHSTEAGLMTVVRARPRQAPP